MRPLPVVCIEEADWGFEVHPRRTVGHMLQLLEQDGWIDFSHVRVADRLQLQAAVHSWALHQPRRLTFVYLSLHGGPGELEAGGEPVALDDLAEWLGDRCAGRIFHLGACGVLADGAACRRFVRQTGARALCGYRTEIGWLAPVAFEMLLLASVANEQRVTAEFALEDVKRNVRALSDPLEFKVYRHPGRGRYDEATRRRLPGL